MSTQSTKDQRGGLAIAFAGVDEQTRMLLWLTVNGVCPFCFANVDRQGPVESAIKRGLVGDDLKTKIADARKHDAENGIDSETSHALDCPLPPEMK
jgi:hypothetical protein